eukprot:1792663-Rhodomonas_salina.1
MMRHDDDATCIIMMMSPRPSGSDAAWLHSSAAKSMPTMITVPDRDDDSESRIMIASQSGQTFSNREGFKSTTPNNFNGFTVSTGSRWQTVDPLRLCARFDSFANAATASPPPLGSGLTVCGQGSLLVLGDGAGVAHPQRVRRSHQRRLVMVQVRVAAAVSTYIVVAQ